MDFELPPHVIEFRDAVKRVIRDVVTSEMIDEMHTSGTFTNHTLNRALAKEGMLERAVPGMGMGDPLELWSADAGFSEITRNVLGRVDDGRRPVDVVPAGRWQAARTTGSYTLVGCTVGPGFDFADFEMLDKRPDEAEAVRRRHPGLAVFV